VSSLRRAGGGRSLALAIAFPLVAACGGSASPAASPHAGATPAFAGSNPNRVAAIEAQIAASNDPNVAFVVFDDVSDQAKDQIDRSVQLAGSSHIEVLCDYVHHQCEDAASQALIARLGFKPLNRYQGAYQKDGAATPHEQALLTERLFLQLLKASSDYRLTYYNQVQQKPTPLPVLGG